MDSPAVPAEQPCRRTRFGVGTVLTALLVLTVLLVADALLHFPVPLWLWILAVAAVAALLVLAADELDVDE